MTVNKVANQEDVTHDSGVLGYDYNCIRTQPDEIAKATTGEGSVTFGEDGGTIQSGRTAGNSAGVRGFYSPFIANGVTAYRWRFAILTRKPSDYNGPARVGITNADSTSQNGAYVDLGSQQAVVEGSTKAITNNNARRSAIVDIKTDFAAGTTTFDLSGDLSGDVTINDNPSIDVANNVGFHVYTESGDGTNNQINIVYGREVWGV